MAGAGIVLFAENGESICQKFFALGIATNNEAEYNALLRALETSASLGATHVHIKSDSELLVRQMTGRYRINAPTILPLAVRAKELQRKFLRVEFEHVRREFNKTADQLANRGADESEKMRKHT